jgi:hypothetical protein
MNYYNPLLAAAAVCIFFCSFFCWSNFLFLLTCPAAVPFLLGAMCRTVSCSSPRPQQHVPFFIQESIWSDRTQKQKRSHT